MIREPSDIEVKFLSDNYVSRSGIKLKSALDNFNVSANDKICIDVGASTGGFTECFDDAMGKKSLFGRRWIWPTRL